MTINKIKTTLAILLLVIGLGATNRANGQLQNEPPSKLIKFLTYQSGRALKSSDGILGCGVDEEGLADRKTVQSLVAMGTAAIPALEEALDSIEEEGQRSVFAVNVRWLLYSYARIQGAQAFPRFRRMADNPKSDFLRFWLDDAIGLSFQLTAYVSQQPPRMYRCRGAQPRDALNELILAWETDDRPLLEGSLGPRAKTALRSLLQGRTWGTMRAELWHAASGTGVGMGYRFEIPKGWSDPEMMLEKLVLRGISEDNPELDTQFVNRSGVGCGLQTVTFIKLPPPVHQNYQVDNSDLGSLLRLLSACAQTP